MLSIDMHSLTVMEKQQWLQHAIAPRPIALASTIDAAGNVNLSPFSFFNMVSTQPPVVIFCPSRRVRDNTTKHTLQNVAAIPEVVINICDYDMVQQTSLSSCEFAQGTDEFIKAGFTKQKALHVRPPMVKEAKVKLECRVTEIKSLGNEGGAGQLVFAEVICMHIDDSVLNETRTMIDQTKLQHIARLGGDWYSVVNAQSLFKVPKPNTKVGIGVDGLPDNIRNSKVLTGNNLGMLANVTGIPDIDPNFEDDTLKHIVIYYSLNPEEMERELHIYAASLLDAGKIDAAWQVLLAMIY
ncbi:flavin reductase family protein [Limnovirga soli]|uniref:Flavin reductase family protein n=1 Tax=Limnovirga soli TaxID=2656915 RepID=A0A8J8JTL9_9BACT|nr:flavin reductase family protein [Limnovirga soli]NNV55325.1 flavin reductase family protein [Limnovirga soli]